MFFFRHYLIGHNILRINLPFHVFDRTVVSLALTNCSSHVGGAVPSSIRLWDQRNTLCPEGFSAEIFHNCSGEERAPTQAAVVRDLKEKKMFWLIPKQPPYQPQTRYNTRRAREVHPVSHLFIVRLWVTGMVWHLKAWSLFRSIIFNMGFEYLLCALVVLGVRHFFRYGGNVYQR